MAKRKKISNVAEFDLEFLRDLKHRLRMVLRSIERAERSMVKAANFERANRAKATPEQLKAAIMFYQTLLDKQEKAQ